MSHFGKTKIQNDYAGALGAIFDDCPKAVLAAIAVSFATCGGDQLEEAKSRIADEWRILHANGIVPQKPSKSAQAVMPIHED